MIDLSNPRIPRLKVERFNRYRLDINAIEFLFKRVKRLHLSHCELMMYEKRYSLLDQESHLEELMLGNGTVFIESPSKKILHLPKVLLLEDDKITNTDTYPS